MPKSPSPDPLAESLEKLLKEHSIKVVPQQETMAAGPHLPYGSFFGFPDFDFLDANIGLVPFGENEEELRWLSKIFDAQTQHCKHRGSKPIEEVVREILTTEIARDLSTVEIYVTAQGARGALVGLLESLVTPQKPYILYASPNWIFDGLCQNVAQFNDKATSYAFFAPSADRFVENFTRLPILDRAAAVILVDPGNPQGYQLKEGHVQIIEAVSERYGIVPIFDDVFRGLRQQGEPHASQYSKHSIIVETTSKRFGARGLGVTWTLIPQERGITFSNFDIECGGCSSVASVVTEGLYRTGYGEKVRQMLIRNSQALVRGYQDGTSEETRNLGRFEQAFLGMPILTFQLTKKESGIDAPFLVEALGKKYGMGVTSGDRWICQPQRLSSPARTLRERNEEADHALSYLRFCPTKETPEKCYAGGRLLADVMNNYAQIVK
ncbi:aminotransferase class I/II-fold pyridoxal phosphate-dependent enzyme [Candidatus Woesearchaeota archaeon]|nr:aminotransferase class I/II-fold pyridoxal phosphate-dependent enzyme [Candidatus Woesearchaeota archaeon]